MPTTGSQLVEDTPRITMGALRRAGVLASGAAAVIELEASDLAVRAERRGAAIHFEWLGGEQIVELVSAKLRLGEATYFARPDGAGRCTTLYLHDSRLVNRQALSLAYSCQRMAPAERVEQRVLKAVERLDGSTVRGPARGARKERLLELLRVQGDQLPDAAWAHLDKHDEERRKSRRRRPLSSDPPMSVRWALLRGRTTAPRLASGDIVNSLNNTRDPSRASLAPTGLSPLELAFAPLANAPELDLRALRRKRGFARGHKLLWGQGKARRSVLACMLTEGDHRLLRLEIWSGQPATTLVARQDIRIVGGERNGDLFLICPVTGRRVSKVYLRQGRFASPEAQRLRRARTTAR